MTPRQFGGWIAVAGLVVLCAPGPARAQMPPTDPAAPRTPPGWLVTPSVAVAGLWDDNVSLTGDEVNALEDFVTQVSPSLGVGFRGRQSTFALEYRGSYDFYRELTTFDAADHRGRLDFNRRLGRRVTLFARDQFTRSPTTDISETAAAPIVLRRRTTAFNDFRGGLEIAPGPRTSIVGAYGSQWVDLAQDELVTTLLRGGRADMADVTVTQRLTPRLSLGGTYDFQHATVGRGGDSFDIQHAAALIELALSKTVDLKGSAGYAWLAPGRDEERRDAPAFSAGLAFHRDRATGELSYQRSFLPSFGFGGTVQNEEVRAALRLPIGRRYDLTGNAAWRENDSLDALETSLRTITAQGTFAYIPADWLRIELYALQVFQDSQLAGGQISRLRAGLRVTTLHPMRLR